MDDTANKKSSILSWASYDFANTLFSVVVLTSYFPLYITDLSDKNWGLGLFASSSMVLAGLIIPFLGTLTDQTGKTKKYLLITTGITITCLAGLSLSQNVKVLLILFLVGCSFYHISLVFYHSLLPLAAPPKKQGFASGLGVALGYLGVLCILPITHEIDESLGRRWVFLITALLFLISAIPLFLKVPERTVPSPKPLQWKLLKKEWEALTKTFQKLKEDAGTTLFLSGHFLIADVLNALIVWFMVYAREIYAPNQQTLITLLASVNLTACLFGFLSGYLTDKIGAFKILIASGAALCLALPLMGWVNHFALFVALSLSCCSFALAGVWTAGRKVIAQIAPQRNMGQYFGLYSMTTKLSIFSTLFFSILADFGGFQSALRLLIFPTVLGTLFLVLSFQKFKSRKGIL